MRDDQIEDIEAIAQELIQSAVASRQASWLADDENDKLRAQLDAKPDDTSEWEAWWNGVLDIVESAADTEAAAIYAEKGFRE